MSKNAAQILVVDDVPLNLKLLVELLGKEGYIVRPVISGEMALRSVEADPPDLILLDVNMPEMDGYEVCRLLKSDERFREIPVIFVSVADDMSHKIRGFEVGAVDYITKPFQVREVKVRIETHLALYHQQRELARQKQEIETLRETAALINSTLRLQDVLERILSSLNKVVEHDWANIALIDNGVTQVVGYRGYPLEMASVLTSGTLEIDKTPIFKEMLHTRQPLVISDVSTHYGWRDEAGSVRSYIGAPIIRDDEVIGFINLDSTHPNFFQPEHAERLKAFADQLAVAIGNASMFEQARDTAIAEERQRLARELHDAVTQSLFSASVMAESLPMLINHDLHELEQGLNYLARLTKGALAEMRTLLFELRPTSMIETDFSTLLTHLVNSHRARTEASISIDMDDDEECEMPLDVKLNLYRIAQEALNNASKHAHARVISINLICESDCITLKIQDDGRGFDLNADRTIGMGLRIMRERAQSTDISLQITSLINEGTRVESQWKRK
jgi:signal transduction histidine kinase